MHTFRFFAIVLTLGTVAACSSDSDDPSSSATGSDASSVETTTPGSTASSTVTPTTAAAGDTTTGADTATTAVPTTATATTTPAPTTYTVVAGDSLFRIADRNCTTVEELIAANGWDDGIDHVILVGDVVQLPANVCGVEATVPAETALPYTPAPSRTATTPECDAALAAFDAAFAGPPEGTAVDDARQWMTTALDELRAAIDALDADDADLAAALDALDAGEPDVAFAYVTFIADDTNAANYAAMQAAVDVVGGSRYVLATRLAAICPG